MSEILSNEMKKMLQKELKPVASASNQEFAEPTMIINGFQTQNKTPSPVCDDTSIDADKHDFPSQHSKCARTKSGEFLSEINVKYLRHVIFKFLTSPEVEAKQMIRAVSTLLQFTCEEVGTHH